MNSIKIVHSYWSTPFKGNNDYCLNKSSWVHRGFNYMSWALSCLKLRDFYDEVELVTDLKGKALLIDTLELPYTSVKLDLEDLKEYSLLPQVWSLGKIKAYAIQDKPFIHVDGDVYIYKPFPLEITESSLLCQQVEPENDFHKENVDYIMNHLSYIPPDILNYHSKTTDCSQHNAGIIGGRDIDFFKRFTHEAMKFVDNNKAHLKQFPQQIIFPTLFEQYLFTAMAYKEQKEINTFFPTVNRVEYTFSGLSDFHDLPETPFIHLISFFKEDFSFGEFVAQRLWYEYPHYYHKIVQLMDKKII